MGGGGKGGCVLAGYVKSAKCEKTLFPPPGCQFICSHGYLSWQADAKLIDPAFCISLFRNTRLSLCTLYSGKLSNCQTSGERADLNLNIDRKSLQVKQHLQAPWLAWYLATDKDFTFQLQRNQRFGQTSLHTYCIVTIKDQSITSSRQRRWGMVLFCVCSYL